MRKVVCGFALFSYGCVIQGNVNCDQRMRIRNDLQKSGIRKSESNKLNVSTSDLARNDNLLAFFNEKAKNFEQT